MITNIAGSIFERVATEYRHRKTRTMSSMTEMAMHTMNRGTVGIRVSGRIDIHNSSFTGLTMVRFNSFLQLLK